VIPPSRTSYDALVASERRRYESCTEVHELPAIFHYWSNRYILPKLVSCGFSSLNEIFERTLAGQCAREEGGPRRFVSLGAGNCDLEIELARKLRARGHDHFLFDCLDLNPTMLERGRRAAEEAGVAGHLTFAESDLNQWNPAQEYDAVVANYFLHHVVNLENLFEQAQRSLKPGGTFVIADMIGRNGHQRWPEALTLVHEFWRQLPPSYRFNRVSGFYEELYENQDCSVGSFEGIRSQDILPLLLDRFHFQFFLPFANIIDPFVERTFGPNFDVALEWDRAFIDQVHQRDDQELAAGRLTPTHMLAVVAHEASDSPIFLPRMTPESCVRRPQTVVESAAPDLRGPYDGQPWPRSVEEELHRVCLRLAESSGQARQQTAWIQRLEQELEERTTWALDLAKQMQERTAWAFDLDKQLQERTAWALDLDRQLQERTTWAFELDRQLEGRTAWSLSLDRDVKERTAWALSVQKELEEGTAASLRLKEELEQQTSRALALERELHGYIHNPVLYAARLLAGIRNRIRRLLAQAPTR
jgi:SAM-dependent methyltransferase